MIEKMCKKCGSIKPMDEFYSARDRKDGRRSECKECHKQAMRAIYNTQEYREARSEYYKRPEVKQAERERKRNQSSAVRQKDRERQRIYRGQSEVREHLQALDRKRSRTPEFRQRRRKYEQSPQFKQAKQEYYKSEQGKAKLRRAKAMRRSRKARCYSERLPRNYERALLDQQSGRCIYCDVRLEGTNIQLDHILPLYLGGPNMFENLQLICKPCNSRKHNKHPVDFALWLGLTALAKEHRKLTEWLYSNDYVRKSPSKNNNFVI